MEIESDFWEYKVKYITLFIILPNQPKNEWYGIWKLNETFEAEIFQIWRLPDFDNVLGTFYDNFWIVSVF